LPWKSAVSFFKLNNPKINAKCLDPACNWYFKTWSSRRIPWPLEFFGQLQSRKWDSLCECHSSHRFTCSWFYWWV
jgi:hypothetical protein